MSTILHKNVSGTHSCVFAQKRVIAHERVTTTHPDWCRTNHENDPDGGHTGPSWPDIPSLNGTGARDVVSIGTGSNEDDVMAVWVEANYGLPLSPEQARQAGLALIEAASWAKDHAVSTV